jgi:putative hydrolase of the HAD superfamily
MNIRAVIFDVYKTLLTVEPPPLDFQEQWDALWRKTFKSAPRMSLAEFTAACSEVIAREHAKLKIVGIAFPEIYWPDVAVEVVSELGQVSAAQRDEFLYQQAQLQHAVTLDVGAAKALGQFHRCGLILGIASNAQPYTLRELDLALTSARLSMGLFNPALRFWSFENGFSKPNPHAFRLLTARLQSIGIAPEQTLMVGDRLDNDIEPARAQGWQAWHLIYRNDGASQKEGNWDDLRQWLCGP